MTNPLYDQVRAAFVQRFSATPRLFRAPGRINLIGEHTDYNSGFVLPAAIDREIAFAVAPNSLGRFRFYACDLDQSFELPVSDLAVTSCDWANYLLGVLAQFAKAGVPLSGLDCAFGGTIPHGAGLSSSAALETGFAVAVSTLYDLSARFDRFDLVKMAQLAEHEYAGVRCGIMDQFASGFGRRGQALHLDCRSLEWRAVPLHLEGHTFVLTDTRVKHQLASSEYNIRRQECEAGVHAARARKPQAQTLRDLTPADLDALAGTLDSETLRRCRFVLQENQRLEDGCTALEAGDLAAFGTAMNGSHAGLRDDYNVSCPELDFLQDFALHCPGVLGSRMMGGGFGGCTLTLLRTDSLPAYIAAAGPAYRQRFGQDPHFLAVQTADGAGEIQP